MARKSHPQPLTLTDPRIVDDHDYLDNPRSPLSPRSPKSPRSPFRFSSKKAQAEGEQPPMQSSDSQRARTTLPPTQNTVSLPSLDSFTSAQGPEKLELDKEQRPARSGFFSNYKASKSSSRLQPNQDAIRQPAEDSMSRDTERPSKVSSQETSRSGTTRLVSLLSSDANANPKCLIRT
jgi:hypothetical protein